MNYLRMGMLCMSLLCLLENSVWAQEKKITGKITDYKNRSEHLIGATVREVGTLNGTVTDKDGAFEIVVAETAKQLAVSMVGYQEDTIAIPANGEVHLFLKQEKVLNEVVFAQRKKGTEISMLDPMKVEKIGQKELMKAACCNLSESFETTPSIDIAYTDAVTGYKQIQMLGLAGPHTLITRENIPDVRGLASITGLTYTPGAWIESMQLSKGTGSVVNGFEGLAGQLNVEWRKTFSDERWHFNLYQNSQGRTEGNMISTHLLSNSVSTNVLLHGRTQWLKVDQNNDGYLDQPMENQFVGANRWFIILPKNYEVQVGVKGVWGKGEGGQVHAAADSNSAKYGAWKFKTDVSRLEAFTKLGKVFGNKMWKSMGWQNNVTFHESHMQYGRNPYHNKQTSLYSNLIYQTIIDNTNHVIKGGANATYDQIEEQFSQINMARKEWTAGAFAEYAYSHFDKFNVVAGIRGDYNNLFGFFMTPRLHLRYSPVRNTVIRASAGRAQRTPNTIAENLGYLASNRTFVWQEKNGKPYELKPEVAWNYGGNITQKFKLNYREGSITGDFYYTRFSNQLVADIENPYAVHYYNVKQPTGVYSAQLQLDYEPIRHLDVRLAYRYIDAKIPYMSGLKDKVLMAKHRAFVNVGYETRNKWLFDATANWIGSKRVPTTIVESGHHNKTGFNSPSYILLNAQISKIINKSFEVYLGGENLTNQMQHHLVLNSERPYDAGFDASVIWGAAMGRNIYMGLRYTFNKK